MLAGNYEGFSKTWKAYRDLYIASKEADDEVKNAKDKQAKIAAFDKIIAPTFWYNYTNTEITLENKTTSALHLVCQKGDLVWFNFILEFLPPESVKFLLEQQDSDGNTVAHIAAQHEQASFIRKLRENKVDFKIKNKAGFTVTDVISKKGPELMQVVEDYVSASANNSAPASLVTTTVLEEKAVSPIAAAKIAFTGSMIALIKNQTQTSSCQAIIDKFFKAIPTSTQNVQAIATIRQKHLEELWHEFLTQAVDWPVELGYFSHSSDTISMTPVQAAAYYGKEDILDYLLTQCPARYRAKVINTQVNDTTALQHAIKQGHLFAVNTLCNYNAHSNVNDIETLANLTTNVEIKDVLRGLIKTPSSNLGQPFYTVEVNKESKETQDTMTMIGKQNAEKEVDLIPKNRKLLASQKYTMAVLDIAITNLDQEINKMSANSFEKNILAWRIKNKGLKIKHLTTLQSYFALTKDQLAAVIENQCQHAIVPDNYSHIYASIPESASAKDLTANNYASLVIAVFKQVNPEEYALMVAGGSFTGVGLGSQRTLDLVQGLTKTSVPAQVKERDYAILLLNEKLDALLAELQQLRGDTKEEHNQDNKKQPTTLAGKLFLRPANFGLKNNEINTKTLKAAGLYKLIHLLQDSKDFEFSVNEIVSKYKKVYKTEYENAIKKGMGTGLSETEKLIEQLEKYKAKDPIAAAQATDTKKKTGSFREKYKKPSMAFMTPT
ncbi:MAG: ankyrin repeat domain-containing protein [Legionellales bacterium]